MFLNNQINFQRNKQVQTKTIDGPTKISKLSQKIDELVDQDTDISKDLTNKRFKQSLLNEDSEKPENVTKNLTKKFGKKYLDFISMSPEKENEVLSKIKNEIDHIQETE